MTSKKALHDGIRAKYIKLISDYLASIGEEVLVTNSNEISVPCVDSEQNDEFLVLTFKVPTGTREGEAYDGYEVAKDYARHCAEMAEKAKVKAEEKARKIERDRKMREEKARLKAEREATEKAGG